MERRRSCTGGAFGWGAMLAATILSSCFLLTEGQSTPTQILIRLQPEHPIEGQEVTLIPEGPFANVVTYRWYRGLGAEENNWILTYYILPSNVQDNGTAFTGRETGGPEGTLRISKLTSEDTGNYTLIADIPGNNRRGSASLVVSENLSIPTLESTPNGMVKENTTVTLNCRTSNSPDVSVSWFKDGKPLPDGAGLSNGNRTLTLSKVTKRDTGLYSCKASNLVSNPESSPVNITVACPAPLGGGAIAGILIGSLAVTALIVGGLLYVFLRAQRDKAPTQTVPAAPVTYENVFPSRQAKADSSANSNQVYETLQHADQSVYQQLKGSR